MNALPLAVRGGVLLVAALTQVACSLGEGDGDVASDALSVTGCWNGDFDLRPDFFAAVPFRNTLTLRVQHGGDIVEVSDGLSILVDDIDAVRQNLDTPLAVGLPVGVSPPGVPIVFNPNPAIVHATLYLHHACHAQNSALYGIGGSITFHAIFDGDINETDAEQKLTDAEFSDISVADPRELVPVGAPAMLGAEGGDGTSGDAATEAGPSADGGEPVGEGGPSFDASTASPISHIHGRFRFYFERGQPAQPFP